MRLKLLTLTFVALLTLTACGNNSEDLEANYESFMDANDLFLENAETNSKQIFSQSSISTIVDSNDEIIVELDLTTTAAYDLNSNYFHIYASVEMSGLTQLSTLILEPHEEKLVFSSQSEDVITMEVIPQADEPSGLLEQLGLPAIDDLNLYDNMTVTKVDDLTYYYTLNFIDHYEQLGMDDILGSDLGEIYEDIKIYTVLTYTSDYSSYTSIQTIEGVEIPDTDYIIAIITETTLTNTATIERITAFDRTDISYKLADSKDNILLAYSLGEYIPMALSASVNNWMSYDLEPGNYEYEHSNSYDIKSVTIYDENDNVITITDNTFEITTQGTYYIRIESSNERKDTFSLISID